MNGIERKTFPIKWNEDDSLLIKGRCTTFVKNNPVPQNTYVEYHQIKIMLYEGWGGKLPTKPLDNTEGCSLNKITSKYIGDGNVQSFLNLETDIKENKPPSTYNSINKMPTNWKIGDNYIFVKDWQTSIADISLAYDKNNRAYWCGGTSGNRKIYNVNEIISRSGVCYAIPSSIAKQNIECCVPRDCLDSQYTCNPDTWKCEETRWCDSELDCQQVFGEGVCQNKQIVKWSCNFNKKWGTHTGTCEKKIRSVTQCSDDCTSSEYYNEEEGKCKTRIEYIDCPPGKCCDGGDSYKQKTCSSGLVCCKSESSSMGECKTKCKEENNNNNNNNVNDQKQFYETVEQSKSKDNSSPSNMFFITCFLIFVIFGGLVYYSKHIKEQYKEIVSSDEDEPEKNRFCKKCGAKIEKGSSFCEKCGNKV